MEGADAEVAAARGEYEAAAAALAQQRAAIAEAESGIGELAAQKASLEAEATDAAVARKKLEHRCCAAVPRRALPLLRSCVS